MKGENQRAVRGPRSPRPSGALLALTKRDIETLGFLGVMRLATAEQIVRSGVGFTSVNYATKRLRVLAEGGLVEVLLVHAREPNLYRLTRTGIGVLRVHRPEIAGVAHLPGAVDLGGLVHQLAIVDTRLYCAALGELRGSPLLRWQSGAGELAETTGLSALGLIPDGLAVYEVEGTRVVIAIEVDAGTENTRTLQGKFARYASASHRTLLDALWVVVAAGERRAQTIQSLLDEAGLRDWTRVMSRAHVVARPVRELPSRTGPGPDMASGHDPRYAAP